MRIRTKPLKKYDPTDYQIEVRQGVYKSVAEATREELEQAICHEQDLIQVLLKLRDSVGVAFLNFGWHI